MHCLPSTFNTQALTQVLKAVFDHARSTQPIKLGPLQELLVEVGCGPIWEFGYDVVRYVSVALVDI